MELEDDIVEVVKMKGEDDEPIGQVIDDYIQSESGHENSKTAKESKWSTNQMAYTNPKSSTDNVLTSHHDLEFSQKMRTGSIGRMGQVEVPKGEKYYALLTGDKLKLFESPQMAIIFYMLANDHKRMMHSGLKHTYQIARNNQTQEELTVDNARNRFFVNV
mmetsp:Transcript_4668/g.7933  ORF Transcript_4668/g.7933 Transcript_4668/m.7933 type:complete len:161 (-) Transcript_4668:1279-1761(-)